LGGVGGGIEGCVKADQRWTLSTINFIKFINFLTLFFNLLASRCEMVLTLLLSKFEVLLFMGEMREERFEVDSGWKRCC